MSSDQDRQQELAQKIVRNAIALAASYQLHPDDLDKVTAAVIANVETAVKAAGWRPVAGEYYHDRDVKRITYEMPGADGEGGNR